MAWEELETKFSRTNVLAFLLGILLGIELGYWVQFFSEVLK